MSDDASLLELDAELEEVESELDATDPGTVAATDEERKLHRFVRYVGRLRDELERLKAESLRMVTDLERKLAFTLATQGPEMEQITRRLLKGKARHVKTPWGRAGLRTSPAQVRVCDDRALLEAVSLYKLPPELVATKTETRPVMAEIKKFVQETGELPAGVEIVPAFDTFYTK